MQITETIVFLCIRPHVYSIGFMSAVEVEAKILSKPVRSRVSETQLGRALLVFHLLKDFQ